MNCPQPITTPVSTLSAETMAECAEAKARIAALGEAGLTPAQKLAHDWAHTNWHAGKRIAGADSSYTAFWAFCAGMEAQKKQPIRAVAVSDQEQVDAIGTAIEAIDNAREFLRGIACSSYEENQERMTRLEELISAKHKLEDAR